MRFAAPPLAVAAALAAAVALASAAAPPARADVKAGDEAPDFTLKDQEGNDVTLSAFRGKKNVVVAFYPKDFTPGCTAEMKCVVRERRKIEERGAVVLGVSGDAVASHKEFATSLGIKFPLLADADFAVAKKYGVYVPSTEGGYAARSVFVVDLEGKVRWAERDFLPPKTLEGGKLLQELDLIRPKDVDPAEAFAALPSPEKEAKTLFVRYVQAVLREDIPGVEALLHADYGLRPGETPAMARERRKSDMERLRKVHDEADLGSLSFGDVVDVREAKVFAKGDHAKPGALAGFGDIVGKAAAALAEGDLLVGVRTKAKKLGETEVLPRELCIAVRKAGDAWKIVSIQGK
jgi:peroxiredoxin Q/BCP